MNNLSAEQESGRILIVDDESEVLATLRRQLRRNFQVFTAGSGKQALQILEAEPIDVVISDQRMPGMTGSELLTAAWQLNPDCVRIILTGYSDQNAVIEAVNSAHIHGYMTKPWNVDEVRTTIRQAVHIARLRGENKQLLSDLKIANELLEKKVRDRTLELESALEETERAMFELYESKTRFQALAENIPIGIIATDRLGRIEFANYFWYLRTGTSIANLTGSPWYQLIREMDRKAVQADWNLYLETKSGEFASKVHLSSASEDKPMIFLRAVALYGNSGSCTGFLFSAVDSDFNLPGVMRSDIKMPS